MKLFILSHGQVPSDEDGGLTEHYEDPVLVFLICQGVFLSLGR